MSVKQLVAASSPQFDSLSGHCSDGAGVIPAHFPQDFRQSAPTLEQSDLANSAQFVNLSKQSLEGAGVRPGQRPPQVTMPAVSRRESKKIRCLAPARSKLGSSAPRANYRAARLRVP